MLTLTENPYISLFLPDGDKEARTPDPYNAIVVLYQLSYDPKLVSNLLDRVSCCQEITQFVLTNHCIEGCPYSGLLVWENPQATIGIFAETSRFESIVFD